MTTTPGEPPDAVEELGAATSEQLVSWSDEHLYDFTLEEVNAWLEDARHREVVAQRDAFHSSLASPPAESKE